jgi:hypothetical protein
MLLIKHERTTKYKNNSRDSSRFKGCNPLQLFCNLTGKCHAIGYYSYTNRYGVLKEKQTTKESKYEKETNYYFNLDFSISAIF